MQPLFLTYVDMIPSYNSEKLVLLFFFLVIQIRGKRFWILCTYKISSSVSGNNIKLFFVHCITGGKGLMHYMTSWLS